MKTNLVLPHTQVSLLQRTTKTERRQFLLGSFSQCDKITVDVVRHTGIVHELFQKGGCRICSESARVWLSLSRSPHDDADRKRVCAWCPFWASLHARKSLKDAFHPRIRKRAFAQETFPIAASAGGPIRRQIIW